MNKSLVINLVIISAIFTTEVLAVSPQNFVQAKHIIKNELLKDLQTIYSGCAINNNKIDFTSCNFKPNPAIKRDLILEFEHMLPMEHAKHHFLCWRKPLCADRNGHRFKGRRCCQQIDPKFKELEAELYNLMPEIGSINRARSAYKFTKFSKLEQQHLGKYQTLPIYINHSLKRIEPRNLAKGIVARANLFVASKYKIRLSSEQLKLFQAWNKQFPPTQMELVWAKKISEITGVKNYYIINWSIYNNKY